MLEKVFFFLSFFPEPGYVIAAELDLSVLRISYTYACDEFRRTRFEGVEITHFRQLPADERGYYPPELPVESGHERIKK